MLKLNYSQIKYSKEPVTHIECDLQVADDFIKRSHGLVYRVDSVLLTGDLFYNQPFVTGNFQVQADLLVPSSRSLDPVKFKEDFHFSENYTDVEIAKEEIDESDIPIVKVEHEVIDLQKAIEDNILLNIPTTILTTNEQEQGIYPEGKGWRVISEKDFNKKKDDQINPAFAKLKDLFKENNEKIHNGNNDN